MSLFKQRLEKLGFGNYQEYLSSDYWRCAKERYMKSSLPKKCIVCGSRKYQLHHRSYVRLGDELTRDLIPLCGDCHLKTHKYLKSNDINLSATHKAIKEVFKLTKKETKKMFKDFTTNNGFGWVRERKVYQKTNWFDIPITGEYSYRKPGEVKVYKMEL